MKELFKQSKFKRGMAVIMAVFMALCTIDTGFYQYASDNVLRSDASVSPVVKAYSTGDHFYDFGTMRLSGVLETGVSYNNWRAFNIESIKADKDGVTLPITLGDATEITSEDGASLSCFAFESGSDDTHFEYTDFRAGIPNGETYFYVAEGVAGEELSDRTDGSRAITWSLRAWPKDANANSIQTFEPSSSVQNLWNAISLDIEKEKLMGDSRIPADDLTHFDTPFSKSRPVWKSGNTTYADFLTTLGTDPSPSDISNAVANGNNLKWYSDLTIGDSLHYPWLRMRWGKYADHTQTGTSMPTYFGTNSGGESVLVDTFPYMFSNTDISEDQPVKDYVFGFSDRTKECPMTYLPDSSSAPVAIAYNDPVNIIKRAYDSVLNGYSYTLKGSTDSLRDKSVEVGNYLSISDQSSFTPNALRAPAENSFNWNGDNIVSYASVGTKSVSTQLGAYWTSDKDPRGRSVRGFRLYGFDAKTFSTFDMNHFNEAGESHYVVSMENLNSSASDYNTKFMSAGASNTAAELLVSPLYDMTYDIQRAKGTITGILPSEITVDITTAASDATLDDEKLVGTGTQLGYFVPGRKVVIKDKVHLENLDSDRTYYVIPSLYYLEDGAAVAFPNNFNQSLSPSNGGASNIFPTGTTADVTCNIVVPDEYFTGSVVPSMLDRTIVVFEEVYTGDGELVGQHFDPLDEDQYIVYTRPALSDNAIIESTMALDSKYELHQGVAAFGSTIVDTVTVSGLSTTPTDYVLVGQLWDVTDPGSPTTDTVGDGGTKVQRFKSNVESESDTQSIKMTFDAWNSKNYGGKKFVVVEKLYLASEYDTAKNKSQLVPISKHEDYNDSSQMVYYKTMYEHDNASIESTTATDGSTNSHVGKLGNAIIRDKVVMKDLTPNADYVVKPKLWKIESTGGISPISGDFGTYPFTASSTTETLDNIEIKVNADSSNYGGNSILVQEFLYRAESVVDNDILDSHPVVTGRDVNPDERPWTPDVHEVSQIVSYPKIETQVSDHSIEPINGVDISDHVVLTGLIEGAEYRLEGRLWDVAFDTDISSHKAPVIKQYTFTADGVNHETDMVFEDVDLSEYAGKDIVVLQTLYAGNPESEIAVTSKTDRLETFSVTSPTVNTTLTITDSDGESQLAIAKDHMSVTDNVVYTGLKVGSDVVYKSVLKLVDQNGKEIPGATASETWTNDSVTYRNMDLTVEFNAIPYKDQYVTAYNYLYRIIGEKEYLVASEEFKPDDEGYVDQTVGFPSDLAITTKAYEADTKSHTIVASDRVNIKDVVTAFGLTVGTDYLLQTKIWDVTAGDFVETVDIDTEFTAETMSQKVTVDIDGFDASALAGHTLVIFEYLWDSEGEELLAKHEQESSELQTIIVDVPVIDTVAISMANETKILPCAADTTIIDTVTYEGLVRGKSYIFLSKVCDKTTGKMVQGFKEVSTSFTPTASKGTVDITIPINTLALGGKELVVTQKLMFNNSVLTEHSDMKDEDQTVIVEKPVITTSATYGEKGAKLVPCIPQAIIMDEITYTDFQPGTTYTIQSTVYDRATKKILRYYGYPMDPEITTFTPKEAAGKFVVEIPIDTTELGGKNIVVYEEVYVGNVLVCEHKDITDRKQTLTVNAPYITTTALGENNSHDIAFSTSAVINDTVYYHNLEPGETYNLYMVVYDKETGKVLTVTENNNNSNGNNNNNNNNGNGNNTNTNKKSAVTANASFTPETANGEFTISTTFDATQFVGKTLVVYEELSIGGYVVASHKDLNDSDQTVKIVSPGISTVATDAYNGTHTISDPVEDPMMSLAIQGKNGSSSSGSSSSSSSGSQKQATINDVVTYSGLKKGESYTLKTTLVDKATGEPVGQAKEISTNFEAEGWDGKVTVPIPVDTSELLGKTLVVYEELSSGKNVGATHKNINDANQTVYVGAMVTLLQGNNAKAPKDVGVSSKTELYDTVAYYGLEPGTIYTIVGKIMNKDAVTGQASSRMSESSSSSGSRSSSSSSSGSSGVDYKTANTEAEISVSDSGSKSSSGGTSTSKSGILTITGNKSNNNDSSSGSSENNNTDSSSDSNTSENNGNSNATTEQRLASGGTEIVYGRSMQQEVGSFSIAFKPTSPNGMLQVPFIVDTRDLQQHELVAYEVIYKGNKPVIGHQDINDTNQTVKVGTSTTSSWKTGVESHAGLLTGIAIAVLGLASVLTGVLAYRRKRNR